MCWCIVLKSIRLRSVHMQDIYKVLVCVGILDFANKKCCLADQYTTVSNKNFSRKIVTSVHVAH